MCCVYYITFFSRVIFSVCSKMCAQSLKTCREYSFFFFWLLKIWKMSPCYMSIFVYSEWNLFLAHTCNLNIPTTRKSFDFFFLNLATTAKLTHWKDIYNVLNMLPVIRTWKTNGCYMKIESTADGVGSGITHS